VASVRVLRPGLLTTVQDTGRPGLGRFGVSPSGAMDPIFMATVEVTEEAIINAMIAAETMTGADYIRYYAIPHEPLRASLRSHGLLTR